MKLISIIIPLYNSGQYILKCLQSIKEQTIQKFEIIIVNDGSIDDSLKKVREFQKQNNLNIKIITQENQGVSAARNRGMNEASGDYFCFIDSDDMMNSRYLERLLGAINNHKDCDVALCGFYRSSKEPITREKLIEREVFYSTKESILSDYLFRRVNLGICYLLVKKDLIIKNHLEFRPGFAYGEDTEMLWRILSCCTVAGLLKEKLYFYRIHKDSAMTKNINKRKDGFLLMKELENYFEDHNPQFSKKFKQYGTARWVWGNLRQLALYSENYKDFQEQAKNFHTKQYLKNLIQYPQLYVAMSSILFCISGRLYYIFFIPIKLMKSMKSMVGL